MLFNSFEFLLLFLPVVVFGAWRLKGRALLIWLSLSSFGFYALAGHPWFLIPMLVTTVLDFWVGKRLAATRAPARRKLLLAVSLVGNLGLLGFFKYAGLLSKTGQAVSAWLGGPEFPPWMLDVMLPAGISFYTFQTLSYVIDVWRKDAPPEKDFWLFSGFVSFFPHLVAGPLTRHNQLMPQLKAIARKGCRPEIQEAVALFGMGLMKKVIIGDQLAKLVDPVIANLDGGGFLGGWLALFGYAFQIYFDFSGYSDMAIGLGLLFGIRLPQNFNSPYQSASPREFWTRWHITLSTWLRDYLYISLGGNRISSFRTKLNLLITMVLGGLWHGANWTFAVWGLYHGLLLAVTHRGKGVVRKPQHLGLRRSVTFVAICLGWVFFRSDSFAMSLRWLSILFDPTRSTSQYVDLTNLGLAAVACFAVTRFAPNSNELSPAIFPSAPRQVALACGLVVALLLMNQSARFLYFQF